MLQGAMKASVLSLAFFSGISVVALVYTVFVDLPAQAANRVAQDEVYLETSTDVCSISGSDLFFAEAPSHSGFKRSCEEAARTLSLSPFNLTLLMMSKEISERLKTEMYIDKWEWDTLRGATAAVANPKACGIEASDKSSCRTVKDLLSPTSGNNLRRWVLYNAKKFGEDSMNRLYALADSNAREAFSVANTTAAICSVKNIHSWRFPDHPLEKTTFCSRVKMEAAVPHEIRYGERLAVLRRDFAAQMLDGIGVRARSVSTYIAAILSWCFYAIAPWAWKKWFGHASGDEAAGAFTRSIAAENFQDPGDQPEGGRNEASAQQQQPQQQQHLQVQMQAQPQNARGARSYALASGIPELPVSHAYYGNTTSADGDFDPFSSPNPVSLRTMPLSLNARPSTQQQRRQQDINSPYLRNGHLPPQ